MSDNSQLELIREAANRPPYKQTVYVNAGQLLAEIEREYVQERTCRYEHTDHCTRVCTSCGREVETFHLGYNYCPRCGAYIEIDKENAMFRKVVRP